MAAGHFRAGSLIAIMAAGPGSAGPGSALAQGRPGAGRPRLPVLCHPETK